MRDRDYAILRDLDRFRCLSRDDLIALYFSHLKAPVKACSATMSRLRLLGYVEVNTQVRPYVYFPAKSTLRKDSQKIEHFRAIAGIYRELRQAGGLRQFDVEPKFGAKGTVEPDIFAIWRGSAWFIEVQRSVYSDKTMRAKLRRYEQFKREGKWRRLDWQPQGNEVFPIIWIIGERRYDTSWVRNDIHVVQSRSVAELLSENNVNT